MFSGDTKYAVKLMKTSDMTKQMLKRLISSQKTKGNQLNGKRCKTKHKKK